MPFHTTRVDGEVRILVSGRFDFVTHQDFRASYHPWPEGVRAVTVDLSQADYLDSSALGMLLVLRKVATVQGADVELVGASATVLRILEIANFDRLFRIPAVG